MKHKLRLYLFLALLLSFIPEGMAATKLRVGIYDNPPLVFMSPDGRPRGLIVDIFEKIAKRAHWEPEYVPGTFQEGLDRLEEGHLDFLLAVGETPGRAAFVSFSKEALVFNWGQLVCRRAGGITSLQDLKGRTLAVLKGDIFYSGPNGIKILTRTFGIDCRFLELSSYAQVTAAVAIGKADAGVVNRFFTFSGAFPASMENTPVVFSPISVAVAASKAKASLLNRFDAEFLRLKSGSNSTYAQILRKWLVRSSMSRGFWEQHRGYFVTAFLALFLLAVYTFFLLLLIRQKTRQTRLAYQRLSQEIKIHRQTSRELLALSSLVEQAEEGIIIVDSEGRLLLSNPAAGKFFGVDFSGFRGQSIGEILGGDSGFLDEILAATREGKNWDGEAEIQGEEEADGGAILGISAFPVRDGSGNILFHGLTMWDVTRERKLERQVQQKQKLELVGQLAAGIAHDFNNLLTVIRGSTELIQLKNNQPQVMERAEMILRATDRAAILVSQLLGFSRKQMRVPRPVDLKLEFPEFNEILSRLLPENIHFSSELNPGLPVLEADPTQLHQVLINLITNARDALEEAHDKIPNPVIRLRIYPTELDAGEAEKLELKPGNYAAIEVADNGPGIQPELKKRIFEPFFTTKEVGKGSGLGLATVQGIARQNDGAVMLSEGKEGGAVFTVYWPLPSESISPSPIHPPIPEKTENFQGKILVVEDEAGVLDFAREVFSQMGFEVLTATSGDEALEIFNKNPGIAVVFTDVILPGMSGVELSHKIKGLNPDIQVAFTSGYDREKLSRHGVGSGSPLLQKPYSLHELREFISKITKC